MVHAVNRINESVFKLHICKYGRMQIFIVCFYVSVMAICFPAVLFVYLYCTEKVVSYIKISKFKTSGVGHSFCPVAGCLFQVRQLSAIRRPTCMVAEHNRDKV